MLAIYDLAQRQHAILRTFPIVGYSSATGAAVDCRPLPGGQNEEYKHLMRHAEDVRSGRFVLMVAARQREQRTLAADILNVNGAEFVGFYGRWAWEGLTTDIRSSTDNAAGAQPHKVATRAEEFPSVFIEAWNSRNPDALASLFDEDAEFVNVTGLWWHDRAAIRKAHAYGLERIFSESTLAIDDTRIKVLSDDVAVVHARMTLSGQTPISTITAPASRRTIFSFLVHRVGDRWQCASAQNTDVVPGMETNVVGEDGNVRSANYQTGRVWFARPDFPLMDTSISSPVSVAASRWGQPDSVDRLKFTVTVSTNRSGFPFRKSGEYRHCWTASIAALSNSGIERNTRTPSTRP